MAFLEEYTLLDELGQGGYATVYKVRHNSLGYIRAVRVLNATIAYGESDKTYQKFLKECRLLLRLGNGNHPNIVHIYQPLLRDQKAIVEMDFVDGKDLFHYLEDNASFVEIDEVMKLLTDIGSALAYCHEGIYKFCMNKDEDELKDDPNDGSKVLLDAETRDRLIKKYRVIHNDIHSGNIMRREDGMFVLLDFGLAVEGDSIVRSSRRKNGATEFKAPEKWDNDGLLTTSSDIYSFGVVLYEFLAGRVPFLLDKKNSNPIEAEYLLGKAHKETIPEPVFELRRMAFELSHPGEIYKKDYPDWLEMLIMKCLEKDPNDRFKNGKELFSYVLEHSSTGSDVYALKEENEKLRNLVEAANASNQKVNVFVTDLQKQLRELYNVRERFHAQITVLQNEKQALQNEKFELLKKESGALLTSQLRQKKIQELENQLNSTKKKSEDISRELSSANKDKEVLKKENQKLKSQNKSKGGKVWKYTTVAFVLISILLCVWASNMSIDFKSDQVVIGEHNTLKEEVKSLRNSDSANQELISSLRSQIQEKKAQLTTLTSEISSLKSANHSMVEQSAITERNKTITQLRTQIKNLNHTINEKNNEIKALQDQLFN